MPAVAPQPAQEWWCDIDGTPIALFCQVEQIIDDTEPTVLPTRLHQQGQVVGRTNESLYVCFEDNHVISLLPTLVRMVDDAQGDG